MTLWRGYCAYDIWAVCGTYDLAVVLTTLWPGCGAYGPVGGL
jgi:hypothetical protein